MKNTANKPKRTRNRLGGGEPVQRWWYTARVENYQGIHNVFYSTTRPKIGDTCGGVAAPNRVIGYRRELAPYHTTKMSKELTHTQIRDRLLAKIAVLCRYWENESRQSDVRAKLEGLAFSILAELDGESADLPAFIIAPNPHKDDKQFRINRNESYYPENHRVINQINGNIAGDLHDHLHEALQKIS